MTNREKYKQAFSVLRASDDLSLEENTMKQATKRMRGRRMAAIVAACIMAVGSATMAYAADVGGIQRTVQMWLHGEQTAATIEFDGTGGYQMEYTDEAGNVRHGGGGGAAIGADGTERPLSEEELMERLTRPDVERRDDGSVWVYWLDQAVEITDKFEDGVCYVELVNGEETLYMTVKEEGGFATSPHRYMSPWEFSTSPHA